jgi:two-component system chemotaxis response regulator CheB
VTPIRVVVIEDSLVQRAHLIDVLQAEGDIVVVGQAGDATEALDAVSRHRPDVVTADLHIPGGGLHAIEQIMAHHPTPVVVLSATIGSRDSAVAVEALVAGALEAMPKPESWTPAAKSALRMRVRAVSGATVLRHPRGLRDKAAPARPRPPGKVALVAVAASSGGPPALAVVLNGLTGVTVPVLVVQHLHPNFVGGFVDWMARVSAAPVELAADGTKARPGTVYIAPAAAHLKVGPDLILVLDAEPASLHRPSADELFRSAAASLGGRAVGVVLTGMGDDGTAGLLALRQAGGYTIAQDEETSAVYGMPRAAQRAGAASVVLPLEAIAREVLQIAAGRP